MLLVRRRRIVRLVTDGATMSPALGPREAVLRGQYDGMTVLGSLVIRPTPPRLLQVGVWHRIACLLEDTGH